MKVALSEIDNTGPNVRTIVTSAAADAELDRSIASQGVLQSLLLRPAGPQNRLQVVLGHRRYLSSMRVGLIEVPVEVKDMTDAEVRLAQLAENMQRQTMHPVDQWRNICDLMLGGTLITQISDALGLDERAIRRMELLGRLNKAFLKLAEIRLPPDADLRVIANAPAKTQSTVAAGRGLIEQRGETETVNWRVIADRCRMDRISRIHAIFDLDKVKIAWDEDLFAQPGDPDEFTTLQVDKFLTAQTRALQEQVKNTVAAGSRAQIVLLNPRGEFMFPRSFQRVFEGDPKKLKRNETAFHAVRPDGQIIVQVAIDTSVQKKKAAATAAEERTTPRTAGRVAPAEDPEDDDPNDDGGRDDDTEELGRHPLTKEGQNLVAAAKTNALAAQIAELVANPKGDPLLLIRLLVIALAGDNIEVRGPSYQDVNFYDLGRNLLEPGGNLLPLPTAAILKIGYTALGRMLQFGGPDCIDSDVSGGPAESIAHIINAQQKLPRFDTPVFLKTVKSPTLTACAIAHEMKPAKSAAALRDQLNGKMPTWRPPGASFGVPAKKA